MVGLDVTDFAVGVGQLFGRCGAADDVQTGAEGSGVGAVAPAPTVAKSPDVTPTALPSNAAIPMRRSGPNEGARVPRLGSARWFRTVRGEITAGLTPRFPPPHRTGRARRRATRNPLDTVLASVNDLRSRARFGRDGLVAGLVEVVVGGL